MVFSVHTVEIVQKILKGLSAKISFLDQKPLHISFSEFVDMASLSRRKQCLHVFCVCVCVWGGGGSGGLRTNSTV